MAEDHGPVMVMLPRDYDRYVMARVENLAKKIYGDTPQALEASGFWMRAYREVIVHCQEDHANRLNGRPPE